MCLRSTPHKFCLAQVVECLIELKHTTFKNSRSNHNLNGKFTQNNPNYYSLTKNNPYYYLFLDNLNCHHSLFIAYPSPLLPVTTGKKEFNFFSFFVLL